MAEAKNLHSNSCLFFLDFDASPKTSYAIARLTSASKWSISACLMWPGLLMMACVDSTVKVPILR